MLDVAALRSQFPSLASGIAHFDGPGGTQTPAVVGEAIARTLTGPLSQRGSRLASQRHADDAVAEFRSAMADLLGGRPDGMVYGRSATALAYEFSRALAKTWRPGDEVVVSQLDHDSNVRPWVQAAEAVGATVRWLELDPSTADLKLDNLTEVITERTRLVAVTAASNLLGTKPSVAVIAARAHAVGALVYVDAVHYAAHALVDMTALGADFVTCSPYKFFGPHCGALGADPALLERVYPDKLVPASDAVPDRFEHGTLPFELMSGVTAAIDFIAGLGTGATRRERLRSAYLAMEDHETALRKRVEDALPTEDGRAVLHSVADDRTATSFFTLRDRDPVAVADHLADNNIAAPASTYYAYEPFRALGVQADAGIRIGMAPYNNDEDVDRLIAALDEKL